MLSATWSQIPEGPGLPPSSDHFRTAPSPSPSPGLPGLHELLGLPKLAGLPEMAGLSELPVAGLAGLAGLPGLAGLLGFAAQAPFPRAWVRQKKKNSGSEYI